MACCLNSPIADQREAMAALAALKSNKTANAAKSAGPVNGAKKAMEATKAIEAMKKSRPNETKKPRVCQCMGCTNCFSAHATLPKPPAPYTIPKDDKEIRDAFQDGKAELNMSPSIRNAVFLCVFSMVSCDWVSTPSLNVFVPPLSHI